MNKKWPPILLLFLLLTIISYSGFPQDQDPFLENYYFESRYRKGQIWIHTDKIAHMVEKMIHAVDFRISIPTYGNKYWHQLYRYPDIGFGYHFLDYGNPAVIGFAHTLYHFLNIPVFNTKHIGWHYQLAFGIGYHRLNYENTKENTAISTRFNAFLNAATEIRIRLDNNFDLIIGGATLHHSNGHIKNPNMGLNIFAYHFGLKYLIEQKPRERIKTEHKSPSKKNEFSVLYSTGLKEVSAISRNKYFPQVLSFKYQYILTLKRKIGLGIDLFYDPSLEESLKEKNKPFELHTSDEFRLGIHVNQDMIVSRFSFSIQMGYYLYKGAWDEKIYNRFGISYKINDALYTHLSIKTHPLAQADFPELGIGYIF